MIKIDNAALNRISKEYEILVGRWFHFGEKSKKGNTKDKLEKRINENNEEARMFRFVHLCYKYANLRLCKPDELKTYIDKFAKIFKKEIREYENEQQKKKEDQKTTAYGRFVKIMEGYYKGFFNAPISSFITGKFFKNNFYVSNDFSIGRWLTHRLGVRVCPYCNRTYTFTINEGDAKVRPQLDHFWPKSLYPCLALSFYNLIPSCSICNHIKREKLINHNPYEKCFGDTHCFSITSSGSDNPKEWITGTDTFQLTLMDVNNKLCKDIEVLGLNELYNEHIDFVEEIIDKAQAYNKSYYDALISSFRGLGKTPIEIDQLVWGSYIERAEHDKRPLSKLTRDILEQLKIKK